MQCFFDMFSSIKTLVENKIINQRSDWYNQFEHNAISQVPKTPIGCKPNP